MQPKAFVKQSFLSLVKSARPRMGVVHEGNFLFGPVTYFPAHFNSLLEPENHKATLSIDCNDDISAGTQLNM